jgi:glutamate synthase (NADPH/NADH) small chain
MLRTESSHEEGGQRHWSILTTRFNGDDHGNVQSLSTVAVGPPPAFEPVPGTQAEFPADLVLLALGFTGPVKNGLLDQLGLELDARGNVRTDANSMTSQPGVFAAGDMRRGQSLIVWAIAEGRQAAQGIDKYLLSPAHRP